MEAKELRIGNLFVTNKGDLLSVCDLHSEPDENTKATIAFKVVDRSKFPLTYNWQAEAIPLTKEWLVKFGFKKNVGDKTLLVLYLGIDTESMYLSVYIGHKTAQFHYEDNYHLYEGSSVRNNLEYVHQLQNLYFALTGNELSLSEVVKQTNE